MMNYVIEKDFTHEGLRCVVVLTDRGHRCGYVGMPESNSLYGLDYDDCYNKTNADCHGGLTYSGGGKNSDYPVRSDLWWFGFDCAHAFDGRDVEAIEKLFPEKLKYNIGVFSYAEDWHVWNTDEVAEECKNLAEVLK